MKKVSKHKPNYKYEDIFRYWKSNKTEFIKGKIYDSWHVQNMTTWKSVRCSSELACTKIIKNCLAELNNQPEPFKHASLEYKAGKLLGW